MAAFIIHPLLTMADPGQQQQRAGLAAESALEMYANIAKPKTARLYPSPRSLMMPCYHAWSYLQEAGQRCAKRRQTTTHDADAEHNTVIRRLR